MRYHLHIHIHNAYFKCWLLSLSPPYWGLASFGEGLVNELCLRNPLPYSQLPCYYSQPECSALSFPLLVSHRGFGNSPPLLDNPPHPSWPWSVLFFFLKEFLIKITFFFFFFGRVEQHTGSQFPGWGVEPVLPAVEARSLHHWTTREAPGSFLSTTLRALPSFIANINWAATLYQAPAHIPEIPWWAGRQAWCLWVSWSLGGLGNLRVHMTNFKHFILCWVNASSTLSQSSLSTRHPVS